MTIFNSLRIPVLDNKKKLIVGGLLIGFVAGTGIFLSSRFSEKASENVTYAKLKNELAILKSEATKNPQDKTKNVDYAYAAYVTGHVSDAIDTYKRLSESNSLSSDEYNILGNLYRKNTQPAEAVGAYKKAIELTPNYITAYVNLANTYVYDMKQTEEGINVLKQAVSQNKNDADLAILLGKMFQMKGDKISAEKQFKAALQIRPNYEVAVKALASLR